MRFSSLKLEAVPFSLAVNTYPTTFAFDTAGWLLPLSDHPFSWASSSNYLVSREVSSSVHLS